MTLNLINSQVSKFNSLSIAQSFRSNCKKAQLIIMGDNNQYWVCSMSFGEKLQKAGYEAI